MTTISNLPSLNTLTNQLIFPAVDLSDGNGITKKVTLQQLVTLSVGPRGPAGVAGTIGPSGPQGPSGPGSNQTVNTSSSVTFQSVSITNTSTGLTFGDGSVQLTAYKQSSQNLTGFSVGNISLSANQITGSILTANPTTSTRNLYLPAAGSNVSGISLIIKNRSNSYGFNVFGGLSLIGQVSTNSSVLIACDGYTWFVV